MKDSELRTTILKYFYDNRRKGTLQPREDDFSPTIPTEDLMHICDQLAEIGYIDWKPVRLHGHTVQGLGRITATGIDVVETDGRKSSVEFAFPINQNITFNSPSNVQIGNQNVQHVQQTFAAIIEKINSSNASPEEKQEAKSRLRSFLEHPLVCATVGGLAGGLGDLLQRS